MIWLAFIGAILAFAIGYRLGRRDELDAQREARAAAQRERDGWRMNR
jgi:hypothetical protein